MRKLSVAGPPPDHLPAPHSAECFAGCQPSLPHCNVSQNAKPAVLQRLGSLFLSVEATCPSLGKHVLSWAWRAKALLLGEGQEVVGQLGHRFLDNSEGAAQVQKLHNCRRMRFSLDSFR